MLSCGEMGVLGFSPKDIQELEESCPVSCAVCPGVPTGAPSLVPSAAPPPTDSPMARLPPAGAVACRDDDTYSDKLGLGCKVYLSAMLSCGEMGVLGFSPKDIQELEESCPVSCGTCEPYWGRPSMVPSLVPSMIASATPSISSSTSPSDEILAPKKKLTDEEAEPSAAAENVPVVPSNDIKSKGRLTVMCHRQRCNKGFECNLSCDSLNKVTWCKNNGLECDNSKNARPAITRRTRTPTPGPRGLS